MRYGLLAVLSFLMLTASASADTTFDFTITGGATASGTLTIGTVPAPSMACLSQPGVIGLLPVVGMTGTFDGSPITFLNPPNDPCNDSYWTGTDVDPTLPTIFSAGGITWWLWSDDMHDGPGFQDFLLDLNTETLVNPIELTYTPVTAPEPSALFLVGIGLLSLLALRVRPALPA